MPLTKVECCGFDCPVTPEQCVDHASTRRNECSYTAEMLSAMFAEVQDRGTRITTTALLAKCLRQEHLTRTEEYTVEPKDLWASFRGTMFHGRLEQYAAPGCIAEPRFYAELPDLGELTGSPDLVDVQRGILYDYKNTGKPPRFGRPWDNHVQQNNINRWLVDNAYKVETPAPVFDADGFALDFILTEGEGSFFYDLTDPDIRSVFVPVDWQKLIVVYLNDEGSFPLECTKSIQVPKKSGEGTKPARVPDIWTDAHAEAFIRERYIETSEALVDGVLPDIPEGFEGQAHVLCNYCPKRARCRELEVLDLISAA
jgi:hypothetical protein